MVEKMCPFTVSPFNLKVTLNKNNKFRISDTSYKSGKKRKGNGSRRVHMSVTWMERERERATNN